MATESMKAAGAASLGRRSVLGMLTAAGGLAGLAIHRRLSARPGAAGTPTQVAARRHDWDWLVGNWDVWHRRLKARLAGSNDWETFGGKSTLWLALGGVGNIDDNIVDIPSGSYRGLSVRAFDPASGLWSIWWLDGRNPGVIDPPVRGVFEGDSGTFSGPDTYEGRPVIVRFRWLDIHGPRPHWEQALSTDGGRTWEINWENFFTRTAPAPTSLPQDPQRPRDFDFLVGSWSVRHRQLRRRLAGSGEWEEFDGTLDNKPVLGGFGNVGDNLFDSAGAAYRGIGLRAFDSGTGEWRNWWLDGRSPAGFTPPLIGRFADGVGTFVGDERLDGRPVKTRVVWSRITSRSARWEQAMSGDGGVSWETNWISEFARRT